MESYIPSEDEKKRIKNIIDELTTQLGALTREYDAAVKPVGSTAKDTFLSGDTDIDIYVISDRYEEAFKYISDVFPDGYRKYGELLIWNIRYKGYDVDIVFIPPDYAKIDTLYHTDYFNRVLSPRDRDEVRKAKAFFKTYGVYGAEVGGIVGVALEELIHRHKTLENICRLFIENDYGDLWIQDPVLKKPRNLLASITKTKYRKIRDACRKYLMEGTFRYKKYTLEEFKHDYHGYNLIICGRRRDRSVDYHTSISVCESSARTIQNLEKDIKYECESYIGENHTVIALKIEPEKLSEEKEVCIPKELTNAIDNFRKAHPGIELYEKENMVCGLVKRKVVHPKAAVENEILKRMEERGYKCRIQKK